MIKQKGKVQLSKYICGLIVLTILTICPLLSSTSFITYAAEELVAAPVVTGAETLADGSQIIVSFDKALTALPESPAGFSVTVNGSASPITDAALAADEASEVELTLETPIGSSEAVVLVSYNPGTVSSLDGGVLAGFSDYSVTNNVTEDTVDTTNTRVSAYLTSINSDSTSTTGELITDTTSVSLNPTIKLVFSNNVIYNADQNISCISLQDASGQTVSNVNIFTLGDTTDKNNPEKTNIFLQPQEQLSPRSTYKIVISPEVLFKNGSTLGEPRIELSFTTAAEASEVTLESALLSGQTLTLSGLPEGADLEYRIVTGETAGEWTAFTYTGTTATVDASALAIQSGVSQVEVRVQSGSEETDSSTVYIAIDGEQATMTSGETLYFEDNVSVTPENLSEEAVNKVGFKRYTIPSEKKIYVTAVGFAYEVYLQGSGEGKEVTLSFPVDPDLNIDQMSVYYIDKSADTTEDKSNPRAWYLQYLEPDRSRADENIISVTVDDIPEEGATVVYQVFLDDTPPSAFITSPPTVDTENHTITLTQIQCGDNDCIDHIEVYRNENFVGLIDGTSGYGTCSFIDNDPTLEIGQTYSYSLKAYDRMGNWSWNPASSDDPTQPSDDIQVLFEEDANLVAEVKQQLLDGTLPITFADGDSFDHVVTDFELPNTSEAWPYIWITWSSSDEDLVYTPPGYTAYVYKPEDGNDKEVTLTATIEREGTSVTETVNWTLNVSWEPWEGGVMPIHTHVTVNDDRDTMYEFWLALEKEDINTIIVEDNFPRKVFPDNVLDAKGKTLIVEPFVFNTSNYDGVSTIIKNAVIDVNGSSSTSYAYDYSCVAPCRTETGLIFENVEFKGGENLDCFIMSQGGSLVLSNCTFGSVKVAPVIIEQGNADDESPDIRIENCTFDGEGNPGYAVYYDKDGILAAVNNTITGYQGTLTSGDSSAGLLIAPGRTATIIGNTISDCDNDILIKTKTTANSTINGVKITDTASATAAGTALLESNELTAGSGSVVLINNVDSLFHPLTWYQAATDSLSTYYNAPVWSEDKTLTASDIDETELTLTWSGASDSDGVTSYEVYQGSNLIATVSDTTYRVTGLMPAITYQFRVEAGNAEGNWSFDGPVTTALTLSNTAPVWPEDSSVTVTEVGPNSIILSWTPANDKEGINTYKVYINGESSTSWTYPNNLSCLVWRDTEGSLQPDTEYTLQVYAEDSLDVLSPGPSVTVKTASGSASYWTVGSDILNVSNLQSTSLTLDWNTPLPLYEVHGVGMKQYKLFCNGEESAVFPYMNLYIANAGTGSGTSYYNITGLQPGTTYTFKLEVQQDGHEWTTDGPSITVTTPAEDSGKIGDSVDLYLQGSTSWLNSITDVQLGSSSGHDGTSVFDQCTITQGHIQIDAGAFTEAKDYRISIRAAGYPDVFVTQTMEEADTSVIDLPIEIGTEPVLKCGDNVVSSVEVGQEYCFDIQLNNASDQTQTVKAYVVARGSRGARLDHGGTVLASTVQNLSIDGQGSSSIALNFTAPDNVAKNVVYLDVYVWDGSGLTRLAEPVHFSYSLSN